MKHHKLKFLISCLIAGYCLKKELTFPIKVNLHLLVTVTDANNKRITLPIHYSTAINEEFSGCKIIELIDNETYVKLS